MRFEFDDSFRALPAYFGSADRKLFGWLHRPPVLARVGAVICPAFGREAECSRRTLRVIAESCAAAGLPALRFDYSGTGDSTDPSRGDPLLEDWLEDAHAAVRFLRETTGVNSVILIGLRLGAAVAALAAIADQSVAGLVAIAATTSGRAYLRELKVLGQTGEHQPQQAAEGLAAAGLLESGGYAWTEATQASIRRIDLLETAIPRMPNVLLMERAELTANTRWEERLRDAGCDVRLVQMSGYPDMMLDPHNAIVPPTLAESVVGWIHQHFELRDDTGQGGSAFVAGSPGLASIDPLLLESGKVLERPAWIGGANSYRYMFGIQTSPSSAAGDRKRTGRKLLFLNSGAVHWAGPGRLYVDLARRRASAGDQVLRIDLAGIGDSPAIDSRPENVVYDPDAVAQTVDAARAFAADGSARVTAVGLCSGAYHALRAAIRSAAVDHVIAINPLIYLIRDGEIVTGDMVMVASTVERYRTNIWQLDSWIRIASGRVNVRAALSAVLRHRLERVKGRLRDFSRRIGMPWKYDLGWELEQLAARGARVDFVFSESDPGYELLRIDAGGALEKLLQQGAIRIHVIPNADHTFTRRAARSRLFELMDRLVDE